MYENCLDTKLQLFPCQVCGDYLLSKMDVQSCISYRNFASCMGDSRLLNKIDGYIQEHLVEISEQEEFLKLPRLKVSSSLYPSGTGFPRNNLRSN